MGSIDSFDPSYTYYEGADEFLVALYLIYALFMLAVSVGMYVLQSLGMYTIAKRRGIHNPWLAWVPVGDAWMLGCISDQYRYVTKGQVKNKRKALLTLQIILWVTYIAFFVFFGMFMVQTLGAAFGGLVYNGQVGEIPSGAIWSMMGMLLFGLIMFGVAIAVIVIRYMAIYDLYHSCEPKNSVLYLVLGIFFSITEPIFVFLCRKKDEGMPPRKPEPAAYVPEPPVEPWENNTEE